VRELLHAFGTYQASKFMHLQQRTIRGIAIILGLFLPLGSVVECARAMAGVHYSYGIKSKGCCTLIAHAGGAIDGNPYTNSREALLLSIRNGYHLIELDFDRTHEGDWYVQHDWKSWALHTGYRGDLPPTAAAVASYRDKYGVQAEGYSFPGTYTVMSLDDLVHILAKHPDVRIITDTKGDDEAIDLIRVVRSTRRFKQFIFQTYSLAGLKEASVLAPQQQLIWTAYLLRDWYVPDGFNEALLSRLKKYPRLFALTIPLYTAHERPVMKRIRSALSIPILVHGNSKNINSRNLHLQLGEWGVNGVYVD